MNTFENKYNKPFWAVKQIVRETGLIEDICEHGIGHPNLEFLKENLTFSGIHGCDSCCRKNSFTGCPQMMKKYYQPTHCRSK